VRHYPAARLRKVRPGTAKRSRSRAEPGCSGAGTALLGGDGGHDLIRMVATTTPGAFLQRGQRTGRHMDSLSREVSAAASAGAALAGTVSTAVMCEAGPF
jgi:hypothetical protein